MLGVLLIACRPVAPAPTPTATAATVIVSATQPSARAALTVRSARVIELRVTRMRNDGRQAVAVRAVLETVGGGRTARFDLGAPAPFPPDQTGTFLLPLPPEARATLAAASTAAVEVTLITVIETEQLVAGVELMLELRALADDP